MQGSAFVILDILISAGPGISKGPLMGRVPPRYRGFDLCILRPRLSA